MDVRLSSDLDEALAALAEAVEHFADVECIDDAVAFKLNLVLDELVTNSISYSLSEVAEPHLLVRLRLCGGEVMAQFEDNGGAFNPFEEVPAPDLAAGIADRRVGGLGVFFVKELTDGFRYERDGNINRITLRLKGDANESD